MTTIRTTCPRCGEVDMGPEAILLSVARGGGIGSYRFLCPGCMDTVEKPADRKIVALLVSAGVDVAQRGPGEEREPPLFDVDEVEERSEGGPPDWMDARPKGPAFTIDDLIRFHFELQDDRRLARFLERG